MPFRGIKGLSGPVHFCAAAKAKSKPVQWYTLRPRFILRKLRHKSTRGVIIPPRKPRVNSDWKSTEGGVPLNVIADNCGTSVRMVEKTYAKILAEKRRDFIERERPPSGKL